MNRTKKLFCFELCVQNSNVEPWQRVRNAPADKKKKEFWQYIPYRVWELWLWNSEFVVLTARMQKPASHSRMWYTVVSLSFVSAWVSLIRLSFSHTNILKNCSTFKLCFGITRLNPRNGLVYWSSSWASFGDRQPIWPVSLNMTFRVSLVS